MFFSKGLSIDLLFSLPTISILFHSHFISGSQWPLLYLTAAHGVESESMVHKHEAHVLPPVQCSAVNHGNESRRGWGGGGTRACRVFLVAATDILYQLKKSPGFPGRA